MFIQSVYMISLSPILVITYPSLLHLCMYVIDESLQILLMLSCQALAQSLDRASVALGTSLQEFNQIPCHFDVVLDQQSSLLSKTCYPNLLAFYSVIACKLEGKYSGGHKC